MSPAAQFFWTAAAGAAAIGVVAALAWKLGGDPAASRAERAAVSDRLMRECWQHGGTANLSARNAYAGCIGIRGPQP